MPSCTSAIRGKIGQLDSLYLVRQMHDQIYQQTPFMDWVMHPLWQINFQQLRQIVIKELIGVDHMSPEDAAEFFKKTFQRYLQEAFKTYISKLHNRCSQYEKLKAKLKKSMPFMTNISSFLKRKQFFKSREKIGLTILNPQSRYFSDFQYIAQAITSENQDKREM